ncbi:MAG: response regulator [Proteobacteria bacterium]|nr:response regulator [Pseudomonadota bacterium]
MLVNLIEHRACEGLLSLIEDINRTKASAWGLAVVKKQYIRWTGSDAFALAIRPALEDTVEAKIFTGEDGMVYITWLGMQRRTYQRICAIVGTMLRPGVTLEPEAVVAYFDPQVMGNEISTLLRTKKENQVRPLSAEAGRDAPAVSNGAEHPLKASPAQMRQFHNALLQRPLRKQLQVLVVEDQQLLRRLLLEVLRGHHAVDAVSGMREGWENYLQKAHDIAFLDIGLMDGDGHTLARAIKQLDPLAYIVIVTAHDSLEELEVARSNHTDGFIVKPYSQQQIADCVQRYQAARETWTKKPSRP